MTGPTSVCGRPRSAGGVTTLLARGILLAGFIARATGAAAQAPPDFTNTVLASVPSPTALAFTPDGRLLVATQLGQLRVYQNDALLTQPALNLNAVACTSNERGLLGIAVDPAFASNGFIYLFYTFNDGNCVNRVSRFVLPASNQISMSSELVLIDGIPSLGNHNAGDLQFGRDGYLYISVGDGGCDYAGNSGCAGANDATRDTHILLGKILRIATDGSIPASNPYRGTDSARCNVTGRTTAGRKCQETFASGLRNPFRMAFDPNASGTRFFINDVGQDRWEEIDLGQAGVDYGWNMREGFCSQGSTTDCSTLPAGLTNPIHAYARSTGCAAITGGAFVPNGVWPSAYDNAYLFADYTCGTIFKLTYDGSTYVRSTFVTGLGSSSVTTMIFGPYAGGQALYLASFAGGGQIRRLHYAGSSNRAPTASMTATPRFGPTPLAVAFDGRGSTDPDGSALTYDWDFGDNSAHATSATPSHTYTSPGQFTARLTVRDPQGATGTASITIDAGNTAPSVSIVSPATTARFRVGETITLQATATDPEDGTLPASALQWTVTLHHNTHTHPFLPPTTGNGITFQAPPPEDFAAASNSYLSFTVTATDSRGLSTTRSQDLLPRTVNLTFATDPAGLKVEVNGAQLTGNQTVVSWDNYALTVNAPPQSNSQGQSWIFQSWSDGGAAQHTFNTPPAATTYTARFVAGPPVPAGLVAAYSFNEGSGSSANDLTGKGHTGAISGATWTAGKYGQGLSFDGADDWVTIADAADLDLTTGMTIEAWVKPTSQTGWETILFKEMPGDHAYVLYSYASDVSGRPSTAVRTAGGLTSVPGTATLTVNIWAHLAATYDGSTLRLYVNGALVGSRAVSGALSATTGPLRIGGNSVWAEWFNGAIDDVRIYNRALSQTEIQSDMAAELGGAQPPSPPTGLRIIR